MKYVCSVCGYIYDEDKEKTAFADLEENWVCPLCGAPKSAFLPEEKEETEPVQKVRPVPEEDFEEDMEKLTAGELSALFSNLARGCEKQYQEEARGLFAELAAYYEAITPPVPDGNIENLAALLRENLDADYARLISRAKEAGDRGTLRICTWGEKVTRILKALLDRYEKEGDALLANTDIWVCSVCGFVYIGEQPPALCPVCKVPAYKFEKIEERRA